MLKSYSSSSTSHKNQKNNNASITLNPKPVAKTRKGTKGPVHICNIYASWIMIIRRMNPYEIFLRMIHHLLWMNRHQKQGDRRPYLQGGSAESVPREAKLFPVRIPIMAPIIQWTVFSLPIDESHPFSDITKLISSRKSMEQISSKPQTIFRLVSHVTCDRSVVFSGYIEFLHQ